MGALGLVAAGATFSVRWSPLFQSSAVWQAYDALIGPPLALWARDRWLSTRKRSAVEFALDLAVLAFCAARALGLVPLASGHVAFFAYAVGTAERRETRLVAAVALLAALALKWWFWRDWSSPCFGGLVGAGAIGASRRLARRSANG